MPAHMALLTPALCHSGLRTRVGNTPPFLGFRHESIVLLNGDGYNQGKTANADINTVVLTLLPGVNSDGQG